MPPQEDITPQQELLALHRQTLAHYLRQAAMLGDAHTSPGVTHGICKTRSEIKRIKHTLRTWGVCVEDHPDDAPSDQDVYYTSDSSPIDPDRLLEETSTSVQDMAEAIRRELGSVPDKEVKEAYDVALLLAKLAIGDMVPEQVQAELGTHPSWLPLFGQLTGKTIITNRIQMVFGIDTHIGDITIHDMIGGESVHLTLDIGTPKAGVRLSYPSKLWLYSIVLVLTFGGSGIIAWFMFTESSIPPPMTTPAASADSETALSPPMITPATSADSGTACAPQDYTCTIEDFRQQIEAFQCNQQTHNCAQLFDNLAVAYVKRGAPGDFDQAIDNFIEVIERGGTTAQLDAHYWLGILYHHLKDYRKSSDHLHTTATLLERTGNDEYKSGYADLYCFLAENADETTYLRYEQRYRQLKGATASCTGITERRIDEVLNQ